ncbi:MAG: hypothetical protein L6R39_000503 [Caloplaca ligustica]|nr:MAG: hypothetical protein L6R39_000503 [Caloplaca ligustica]
MLRLQVLLALSLIRTLPPAAHAWTSVYYTSANVERSVDADSLSPHTNGDWLGWGANFYNNRWASYGAKVVASNTASLHLTCKREYSVGVSAAPLVTNGISYFPTWDGLFVALDYTSCKVLWQTNITDIIIKYKVPSASSIAAGVLPVSRTTPVIDGNVLYLGTLTNALLLAVDKRNGKMIDSVQINDHPVAVVTMSPTLWRGNIFVGGSSSEESAADAIPDYPCCSFIGNMQGLAFEKGHFRLLWNQKMIPAGLNYSGAAIWGSQPSIDPTRKQVFVATGNIYSVPESYTTCQNQTANRTSTSPDNTTDPCAPPSLYQEAVIALDTATGNINWVHQLSPLDAWNVACVALANKNPGACPPNPGPDVDFGMAPSFVPRSAETPFSEDTIIIGQKNGNLYALSADAGKIFWALATSPDGLVGGLIWGVAVDSSAVYYTAANTLRKPWQLQDGTNLSNSAFGAASLSTGKILWETRAPRNETTLVAPTVANDLVLTGTAGLPSGYFGTRGNGSLIALNKRTGVIVRETMLESFFQGGIAVVHDYVMFGTGYSGTPRGAFNVWKVTN